MSRYRSKLEAVVRHRRLREEEIQMEFMGMKTHLTSEENHLRKLRQALEEAHRDLTKRQVTGMEMNEIDLYYRFTKRQNEKLEEQRKVIQRLMDECEAKREELTSAMREKKVVEKIDADREATFNKEAKRKEQRLLDEVAGRPKKETP